MPKTELVVEYFYASYSAYAYLGSKRLMEIAKAAGRKIIHRPVDLPLVVEAANTSSFNQRSKAHVAYYFGREIIRWGEHRGVPIMKGIPRHHRNSITLSNCMLIAGVEQGHNVDQLAHLMGKAHWVNDADLADRKTLADLGKKAGLDPEPLLDAALKPEILEIYEANTQEAIERSVFGSPTYFVDDDMFYGQDRLELMERAMNKPYAGKLFKKPR